MSDVDVVAATQVAVEAEADADGLTAGERDMLVFEREWWRYATSRPDAIRERFEIKPARHDRALSELIDDPRALAFDPMLVKRLRRMRAQEQRVRAS